MASSPAMRWFALALLLPLVQGIAFYTPPLTTSHSQPSEIPLPTQALGRRGASSNPYTTTSIMPGSMCGFPNGKLTASPVSCMSDDNCVFHSSDARFPAAMGCCPNSATSACGFFSTCYSSAQFEVTSLNTLVTDPFVMFCTKSESPYCIQHTYPELGLGGPVYAGCGSAAMSLTILTEATLPPYSSGLLSSGPVTTTVLAVTTSLVGADYIDKHVLGSVPATSSPTSSTSPSSSPPPPPPPGGGFSPSAGVIAGGVVGAVVGVAGIAAAIIMFIIIRRRRKPDDSNVNKNPEYAEVDGGNKSAIEVEGNDAVTKFPEAEGSPRHELENKDVAVELP